MEEEKNKAQIEFIVENKFGKDVSSIIFPYLIGQCKICRTNKFNDKGLKLCKGCNKIYCEECFTVIKNHSFFVKTKYYKDYDFCWYCLRNLILNDN